MAHGRASRLVCGGCGEQIAFEAGLVAQCPRAGDGGDHVLLRQLDESALPEPWFGDRSEPNPYVRFRQRFHAYHQALALGWSDAQYCDLVNSLNTAIAKVDQGRKFHVTAMSQVPALAAMLGMHGALWVKNETEHVSGSHKARHLFNILLMLRVAGAQFDGRPLAIASCGHAALGAAVLAAAAQRILHVFIPTDANLCVVERLRKLGAEVTICERQEDQTGDPCFAAFLQDVAAGAVPFACQGSENGFAIEGGEALGWEIADTLQLADASADRLFVQVGGGALASAVGRGVSQAYELGAIAQLPRLHPVQTYGAFPLARAYEHLADTMAQRLGFSQHWLDERDASEATIAVRQSRADLLAAHWHDPEMQEVFRQAIAQRSQYMWPWETPPHSIAHGILDDETYDWVAILRATLASAGFVVLASEDHLETARILGQEGTGIAADPTGTSGLAGLIALRQAGAVADHERCVVLFTGAER